MPEMPIEIHHQRIKVHSVMPRVVDDVVVFLVWHCLIFAQLLSFTVAAGATHKPDRQSCCMPLHSVLLGRSWLGSMIWLQLNFFSGSL